MVQDDLKAIERIALETVPVDNWQTIFVVASAVETYIEFDALYMVNSTGTPESFNIYDLEFVNEDIDNNDVTEFIQKLRDDLYSSDPGRGTFYSVKIELGKDKSPLLSINYDTKPVFDGEDVPDEWFIKDIKLYPRKPEFIPNWLNSILTGQI